MEESTKKGHAPPQTSGPSGTGAASPQPPAAGSRPGDSEEPSEQLHPTQREAVVARDLLVPAALASIIGGEFVSAAGVKVYVNGFYRDNGDPSDPVEQMMLEQLLLAHHRLAQLHVKAKEAKHPEHVKVLNTATTRLLGEFRRLALALRQYRTPSSPKSFNVVHQQNVVAGGGGQQVTYLDQSAGGQDKVSFAARSELEGNADLRDKNGIERHRAPSTADSQEPTAGGRRACQRLQEAGVDG